MIIITSNSILYQPILRVIYISLASIPVYAKLSTFWPLSMNHYFGISSLSFGNLEMFNMAFLSFIPGISIKS